MQITRIPGFNPGPMTGAGNNTYLLGGRTPTLVDAATGEAAHLSALEQALGSDRLAQVLVTHAHQDHADGSEPIAARWPDAAFRKMPWPERDRAHAVAWKPIADDEVVPAGDGALRAVHTPGHAPDHLCFFDETGGTLLSADLVVPGTTVVIPASHGGSLSQYLASLRRVQALAPARMLPAHGEPIDDPQAILRSLHRAPAAPRGADRGGVAGRRPAAGSHRRPPVRRTRAGSPGHGARERGRTPGEAQGGGPRPFRRPGVGARLIVRAWIPLRAAAASMIGGTGRSN